MTRTLRMVMFLAAAIGHYAGPAMSAQDTPPPETERLKGQIGHDPQIPESARQHALMVYDDTRMKIGIMKHCGENGHIDAATANKAAEIYMKALEYWFYDASATYSVYDRASGDEAERQGSQGFIYDRNALFLLEPGPSTGGQSLQDYAIDTQRTPAAICKKWAYESTIYEPMIRKREQIDRSKDKLHQEIGEEESSGPKKQN